MLTGLVSRIAAPVVWPALRRRGEQTDWRERWDPQPTAPVELWIHSASLGEITPYAHLLAESARPIGITVTSGRSLEAVRQRFADIADVRPLPLPGSPAMRRLVEDWRPRRIVLLEADAWPDLLAAVPDPIAELAVLAGRLNGLTRRLWARHLRHIPARAIRGIWTGSDADAAQWRRLRIPERTIHSGFEPKLCSAVAAVPDPQFQPLRQCSHLTVAGSLHPEEFAIVMRGWRIWQASRPNARLAIVPRHPERLPAFLRQTTASDAAIWPDIGPVTFVPRFGVLAGLYGLADAAIVGGSWCGRGGHNPLEAAVHGIPVVMGPSIQNQQRLIAYLGEQVALASAPEQIAAALARPRCADLQLDALRRTMEQAAREALALR